MVLVLWDTCSSRGGRQRPSGSLCLDNYTTVQSLHEQHAAKVVALLSMVFAGADRAVETLDNSSACQLGGQGE